MPHTNADDAHWKASKVAPARAMMLATEAAGGGSGLVAVETERVTSRDTLPSPAWQTGFPKPRVAGECCAEPGQGLFWWRVGSANLPCRLVR